MAEPETLNETLKRKAAVVVNATPAGGGMEEGPFVCNLPSRPDGMPPEGTEWRAWRKNVEFRGHHLVLRGRTRGVDYVGNNFASAGTPAANACSYFVARLRRVSASGKKAAAAADADESDPEYELDVTPVGGGGIVDLQTRCHAQQYDAPAWDGAEDMNDPSVRAKYNDRLLRAFSSSKRQRKVARIQAERRVDASSLAAPDAMRANLVAATAGELDARALAELAGARRNIPAHDPNATNPHDAYPLRRFPLYALAERSRWKDLLAAAKKPSRLESLRANGDVDSFVLDLVPRLESIGTVLDAASDAGSQKEAAKALAFLDALLAFRSHKGVVVERRPKKRDADADAASGAEKSDAFAPLSWTHETKVDAITQRAYIDAFMEQSRSDVPDLASAPSEPRRFARPKASSDLVTLHCILMTARVSGWTVDVSALAKRLKMSVKDMTPLCRELGLTMGRAPGKKADGGGATTATLKLDGEKRLRDFLPEIKKRPQAAKKRE